MAVAVTGRSSSSPVKSISMGLMGLRRQWFRCTPADAAGAGAGADDWLGTVNMSWGEKDGWWWWWRKRRRTRQVRRVVRLYDGVWGKIHALTGQPTKGPAL